MLVITEHSTIFPELSSSVRNLIKEYDRRINAGEDLKVSEQNMKAIVKEVIESGVNPAKAGEANFTTLLDIASESGDLDMEILGAGEGESVEDEEKEATIFQKLAFAVNEHNIKKMAFEKEYAMRVSDATRHVLTIILKDPVSRGFLDETKIEISIDNRVVIINLPDSVVVVRS